MSCGRPDCHIWEDHGHFDTTGDTNPPKQDWAEERAREWLEETLGPVVVQHAYHQFSDDEVASLAALLREVKQEPPDQLGACDRCYGANVSVLLCPKCDGQVRGLAEVRRVVEEIADGEYCDQGRMAREILSRLDKLTSSKSKDNL